MRRDARQRPHTYRAATDAPAYRPLREILELTVGVPLQLREALDGVEGIRAVAIHGSWAAGRVRPDSDLDVLVVTVGDRRHAQRAMTDVGRNVGRDIDASVLSTEDFGSLLQAKNPFLGKILTHPRIDVIGDLMALARSGDD